MDFDTPKVHQDGAVLFVDIAAPPMNLLGTELIRDLVSLIQHAEADDGVRVLVFKGTDPDYFISHVDVTRIAEYRQEAAKLTGEASIGILFRAGARGHVERGRLRRGAGGAVRLDQSGLARPYARGSSSDRLPIGSRSPLAGQVALKDRVNAIALAPAEDFRRDSDLFLECARTPEAQSRTRAAMALGRQSRDAELTLGLMVGSL